MGKDLKGKELGPGLTQRKDGRYEAKYKDRDGKRKSIYGFKLSEVKRKLADVKYEVAHGIYSSDPKLTVNKWFETWIKIYKKDSVKEATLEGYLYTFKHISREIGEMNLKDVKTIHLQTIINSLNESGYAYSTLTLTRVTMHAMFEQAVIDEYILKNPSKGVKLPTDMTDEKRILTREEEQEFLKSAKGTVNEYAFRLVLMTGMRSGEVSGLRWCDINWEKKELYVRQAVRFSRKKEGYIVTSPKSKTSIRTIPLRNEGIELLKLRKGFRDEAIFSDGEMWITVNADSNARGYRWKRAYVDKDIPQDVILEIIDSKGIFKLEDYKLF